jgi:UDP:flavonoid glycosyltransferase YjiC (YdhE family)
MSKTFLFAVWAGGGNVPPQLALARRLAARGHRVRMLAPAVLRPQIESAGIRYEPYHEAPEHDESVPERSLVRDFEQRSPIRAVEAVRDNLIAGMTAPIAADILSALERECADVIAFDYTLFGALFAAEKAQVPAAMLVHTVYPFPAPGLPPYGMGWAPLGGPVGSVRDAIGRLVFRRIYERPLTPHFNVVRRTLGLGPVTSLSDILDRAARVVVLTTPAFDFPARLPTNVVYVGPQLEEPEWTPRRKPPWPGGDERPLIVVGLSTTYQAQGALLERIVAALADLPVRALVTTGRLKLGRAPANVSLVPYVPHARVLPHATGVVTHAGLGTVHAALAHGLPLVCLPIGRDQPDNAARVVWHGAGLRLSPNSSAGAIQTAVLTVLTNDSLSAAARRLARAIADERPAELGPATLERLAGIGSSMTAPVLVGLAPTPAKPRA